MKGVFTNIFLRTGMFFLSFFFFPDGYSQITQITDSIINKYSKVNSIHSLASLDPDSVYVEDASLFNRNEVALLIVNRGASIYTSGELVGSVQNMNNTGEYTLIYIDTVEYDNQLVIFNSTLPNFTPLTSGERAQLVTVPRYKNATIDNKLTCKSWDQSTGTGGVLALIVNGTLELQADIDVSGKGFKGADPGSEKYEGSCSVSDTGYYFGLFSSVAKDSSGSRGEGIIGADFMYPRGRLAAGNGGGGGNAKFSGGGGGSNAGSGGKGGKEYNICSSAGDLGGNGGAALSPTFYQNTGLYPNRIFMGGGGGAGTQDPDLGKLATRGGSGGGIVIVMANKIKNSGHAIRANGESVTPIATAGAGGGGAGGVVLTDVLVFTDPLLIEVKGGLGGDCIESADTTGPGGGGGAGVYWFSQGSLPVNVTSDRIFGGAGKDGTSTYGALNGSWGINLPNLILPRRGFLENRIPDDQMICENMVPEVLNAPEAKGGTGPPFTYEWIKSEISEEGPWISADGVNNLQNYAPPALTDTTYYARIISDGSLRDTSFAIRIAVHPALINNSIIDSDTVCAQLSAGELTSLSAMEGGLGSGIYAYNWEISPDNSFWESAPGLNTLFAYDTPVLTETAFFRRKVISGACVNISNVVEITVLPELTNNIISEAQVICYEQLPQSLTGSLPSGGMDGDRKYQWQRMAGAGIWNDEVITPDFNPGSLTDTAYFRRIVYSGPGNTCVNISDSLEIAVLPPITNNILNHDQDTTICAGLPTLTFTGLQPSGGDGVYKYIWEKKAYPSGSWVTAEEVSALQPFQPGSLSDTTLFRRTIKSGLADVCSNISDSVLVNVLTSITNNNISDTQIICENTTPDPLNGTIPVGGTGTYTYLWQESLDGSSNWENLSPDGMLADFSPPGLSQTTFYRRAVYSGPENTCDSYSSDLKIEVQPAISDNVILSQGPVFTCFYTQPAPISGSTNPAGGNGSDYIFTWQESNDQTTWNAGSQVNNLPDYQPGTIVNEMYFRRLVNSGVCSDTTSLIEFKINTLPVLNQLSGNATESFLCDDQVFRLKVNIEQGKAPYIAEYQNGIDATVFNQGIQTDVDSFEVHIYGAEPNQFNFKLVSLTDNNGCQATGVNLNTHQLPLDVYRAAVPRVNMNDLVEVCGNSIVLEASPDLGNGYWKSSNQQVHITDTMSLTTTAFIQSASFDILSDKFFYLESSPGCGIRKDSVVVNFFEEPSVPVITNDINGSSPLIVFLADNITLKSLSPTAGSGQWNILSGPGELTTQDDTSAFLVDMVIDELTAISYTVSNGVCTLKTDEITVERKDVKIYEGFSPNGDAINEYLFAEGIDRSSNDLNYVFSIFNSSGAFVRELTNETNLDTSDTGVIWDGKALNGNLAGDGTYYYIMRINYKGREFIYKGFFVLISE